MCREIRKSILLGLVNISRYIIYFVFLTLAQFYSKCSTSFNSRVILWVNGEKTMKTLLTILASVLVSFSAHAGFLAEPWLGYESGTTQCTNASSGADCGAKSTGFDYGARLGWMFGGGFWLAAEYMGGSGTIKYDDGSADDKSESTILGAALGVDLASGLRLFAGYGFSDSLKVKSTTDITFKGTSAKVGLGYKFKNNVSVNLEYIMETITKYDAATLTDQEVSGLFSTFKPARAMLTVGYVFGSGK